MLITIILWLLVWGGMFSDPINLKAPNLLTSPFAFFQGVRSMLPILVVYLVLLWILAAKARYPFIRAPLQFLLYYCGLGIVVSLFLSPAVLTSLYWAGLYLSPILVIWFMSERKDPLDILRKLIYVNYGIFVLITMMLFPESYRGPRMDPTRVQFYNLPFNLGTMRVNGAGRFALVVIIISTVRFLSSRSKKRYFWIPLVIPSFYMLARTQSRTALLGLAVAGALFIFMKHPDWRLLFAGPAAAYVIWLSGFKWRAQGRFGGLISLTGRELTWERAISQIKQSPFLGWGFNADRILLNAEHMHNSYLHAMIHAGILGTVLFTVGFIVAWSLIIKSKILYRARYTSMPDQALLMESVMIFGFLSSRSFFESTGAFYGVDLLLLVPAMTFIHLWTVNNPQS